MTQCLSLLLEILSTHLRLDFKKASLQTYANDINTYVQVCAVALFVLLLYVTKIVSEYDQDIPQSQTADNPLAPRGKATQPSRDTRKATSVGTNKMHLSPPPPPVA